MTNEPIACAADGIDITGCRVSLYPMKDHFAQQILTSIEKNEYERCLAADRSVQYPFSRGSA
jgi:hypothetical protein